METKTKEQPAKLAGELVSSGAVAVKRAEVMADRQMEKRKDAAIAFNKAGWGLPHDPRARTAMMALTAYYGLDPIVGDVLILGGSTLYITEQAYKKKLEEKANTVYGGKPFRWHKRPATPDEVNALGYGKVGGARVWYVELWPPEGAGDKAISVAWGEADANNCALQNISKEAGDPRILNRMAIKRAQHECSRDVVTFRLPTPGEFTKIMGMALEDMLKAGVSVMAEDGIMAPEQVEEQMLPEAPTPAEVVASEATIPEPTTEQKSETVPDLGNPEQTQLAAEQPTEPGDMF